MAKGIFLRRAGPGDLDEVLALVRGNELPTDGVQDWLHNFYLALTEDRIVGAAGYEVYGEHALLRSVVVDASQRGLGIGDLLVNRVLGDLEDSGIRDVYLLTTTAEHYFPRFGFEVIERQAVPEALHSSVEFGSACPATARVLYRSV